MQRFVPALARLAIVFAALACMTTSSAGAQPIPTVNGAPGFCFGGDHGVCLVGGDWTVSGAFFEVTGAARLVLPNGLRITMPSAVRLRIGTTAETASLTGSASLALDAGASGPLAGIGLVGPDVTLTVGEGRDLDVRAFTLGSATVLVQPGFYYLYAGFGSDTRVTLPTLGAVPVPTPADGLSSQLLVGFDPSRPGDMILYLGGGFTTLFTSGVVVDGSVLFSWGASTTMRVGPFVTSATSDATQAIEVRPTFSAQGTLRRFAGDVAARDGVRGSSPGTAATSSPPVAADRSRRPEPLPITIAGGIAIDVDGDRDGRRFESFSDVRFAGTDVSVTIDDVGLGRSLSVGTGNVYYDPSACGALGRLVARVDSVSASRLSGTPLAVLDPGRGGYAFDALSCGTDSLVRLRAGRVFVAGEDAASPFALGDVEIGFGRGGVSVRATLSLFGSDVRLSGTLDGRTLTLRSSTAITLAGLPLSNGAVELVIGDARASVRLTGEVMIRGLRFGIDETFRTPAIFSRPEATRRSAIGPRHADVSAPEYAAIA